MPILTNKLNQPVFAEFAEIIFRFGDAIAVGQKNFTPPQGDGTFFIIDLVKEPNDRTAALQPAQRTIFA